MGTLVAVIGLLVTLLFNTVGVWLQLDQETKARVATQVTLLTQLNDGAIETERRINATDAPDDRCKRFRIDSLSDVDEAAMFAALDYYEYLAWLFNQRHLSVAGSRSFWTPDMIDAYDLGTTYFARSEIEDRFPELTSLRQTADALLWPKDPCPRTPARALPVH